MTSLPTGSVTQWIQDVKSGEGAAAHKLWDAYFDRMVKLANRKLRQASKQEADEEDVAVQALNSFFDGARRGRYPKLNDRSDLWSLLASIVENKAYKVRRRQAALKRGGDKTRVDCELNELQSPPDFPTLEELSLELREQLDQLKDEQLKRIVVMVLHGHTNAEIASILDVHERTIERRRLVVRKRWEQVID